MEDCELKDATDRIKLYYPDGEWRAALWDALVISQGGKVFGIKRKPLDNGFSVFRIELDDAQIKQTDIVAKNMVFKV